MSGVALSSLRVSADLDTTPYVRAAQAKVDADNKMIAGDKARNAALAQADAALAKAIPGVGGLSKTLLEGYGAGAQFEAIVRRIGNAVDRGMGLDRANSLLDAAYRKFGLVADAAVLAERGFVSITGAVANLNREYEIHAEVASRAVAATERATAAAQAQAEINQRFGIGTESRSAQESADAFLAQYGGLEGIARAKAQEAGTAFADDLNSRMITGITKSARDAAATFQAQFAQMDAIAAARGAHFAEQYQAGINEVFARGTVTSAASQGATYSALAEQVQRLDQIEQQRAQHQAQVTQQLIAEANGYDRVSRSARESAAAFIEADRQTQALRGILQEASDAQAEMTARANALRAAINPLDSEMVKLGKEIAGYRQLLNSGAISSHEFEQAQVLMAKRLTDVQQQLRNTGNVGRVASGELVNLGYQLNDIVTGLALGQSPFMIIAQQGGQVFQILQNSKGGITDFFSAIGTKAKEFATIGRVAFVGVAGAVGTAAAALLSYLSAQEKVNMGLLGAGRGSGATAAGINQIANQGSSLTGLSISEARDLATALATTGKVANDNILPIVQMGKDISRIYGVDAPEATKMLADAFSDPARGADQLNQRLGFLDAGMKRNIDNLVAQNNVYGAQKVLLSGVQQSLNGVNDVVSVTTKGWTALGNAISNGWDTLGKFIAGSLGLGASLEDQLDKAKAKLNELKNNGGFQIIPGYEIPFKLDDKQIAQQQAAVDQLTAAIERNRNASAAAAAAQKSFLIETTARSLQSEIGEREKLNNDLKVLHDILTSLGGDEAAGARLAQLGLSMKQLADATAVATEKARAFKSDFDTALESAKTANAAISAFSPSQKGDIARQQSLQANQRANLDATQKQILADQAAANAVKQVTVALSEAGRARELSGRQAVDSAKAEQDMVGKTMAQQETIRANLQARQQLEQEASVNRTAFDEAQYRRLVKINEEYGKQKQLAAEAALNDNIKFGRNTALLSPEDAQIAQQLKFKYTDVSEALNSVEASALRTNGALSQFSSQVSGQLTTGLADIFDGTKSVGQGAADMARMFIRALEEMVIKMMIVAPIMRSLQALSGGFFSGGGIFGGGQAGLANTGMAGSAYFGPVAPSALGNVFSGARRFAGGGTFTNAIVASPTLFRFANGGAMHTGLMGEAGPEAVMPLRRGRDGKLGVSSMAGGGSSVSSTSIMFGDIQINVPESTSPTTAADIAKSVRQTMLQVADERILYHTRQRGRLAA